MEEYKDELLELLKKGSCIDILNKNANEIGLENIPLFHGFNGKLIVQYYNGTQRFFTWRYPPHIDGHSFTHVSFWLLESESD